VLNFDNSQFREEGSLLGPELTNELDNDMSSANQDSCARRIFRTNSACCFMPNGFTDHRAILHWYFLLLFTKAPAWRFAYLQRIRRSYPCPLV
jgi:hypothetical protein